MRVLKRAGTMWGWYGGPLVWRRWIGIWGVVLVWCDGAPLEPQPVRARTRYTTIATPAMVAIAVRMFGSLRSMSSPETVAPNLGQPG
jgi:hypothetical protein